MVKSMTGYGRAVETVNGREFTVEIRSVNNRYLDCTVKMPRAFSFAEDAVKQRVKAHVGRGKVDVFITVNAETAQQVQITLNRPVVEGYLNAMRSMAQEYGVTDDISVTALAKMPEVFLVEKPQTDEEQLKADLLGVVEQALEAYDRMRATEGAALEADLRSRGQTILALVAQVEQASPQTVADYRHRLEEKMREVLESKSIDESRILTEAAIFADKVAVDEETVRLRWCRGQKAGLPASGDEPGSQHHRIQMHRCEDRPDRGGDQGGAGKDPGADPESGIRSRL